ncbi:hypothetical protein R1flu_020141 [Riccia fluitans]|uniref:Uncharacterized protein n=1 Tax=Riccia fluitans TaxID=41844 RepID=A0ABD1ZKP8_9MARC
MAVTLEEEWAMKEVLEDPGLPSIAPGETSKPSMACGGIVGGQSTVKNQRRPANLSCIDPQDKWEAGRFRCPPAVV